MEEKQFSFKKAGKFLATFLMLPALFFFATSCSDDDDTPDPNVITNLPGAVNLAATETSNTATLNFTALSNWDATAGEDSQWFTFEPKSGAAGNVSITITAPYNEGAAKNGKLTIKHGTNTYTVNVTQAVGKPDLAQWNPEDLYNVTKFAPDAYNATESMPAEFTFTVTTKQDYETLEEAPFEIFTFYTNDKYNYEATDSLVNWVEFKIAENSPAANAGKKITLSVKPHEEFTFHEGSTDLYDMHPRIAYIAIAPKGTQVKDMFVDGVLKEEYQGATIEQTTYELTHSGEMTMLGVGQPWLTSAFDVTSKNFKEFGIVMYDEKKEETIDWLQATIEGNHVTLSGSSGHMGQTGALVFTAYRGTELKPLELIHLKPIGVSCMQM